MSLLFSRKFWHERIGLRPRLTFLTGMAYYIYTGLAVFFTPLPAIAMVCFFPDQVFWWNYALLAPALLQTFVFLPLWHRAHYGFSAMRCKIVYSWAHLFAFRDRLIGRTLRWNPTGETVVLKSSGRMLYVKALVVGWPLLTWSAAVGGSAVHMDGLLDTHFWPIIALATVYAVSAACVLAPLRTWSPMPLWSNAPTAEADPPAVTGRGLLSDRPASTPAPVMSVGRQGSDDPLGTR